MGLSPSRTRRAVAVLASPAFGQADLSNCERELIHLAGSIQPHGVLLVVREVDLVVLQASANVGHWLGIATERLLDHTLAVLGGDLARRVQEVAPTLVEDSLPLLATVAVGARVWAVEAVLHRQPEQGLIVELELLESDSQAVETVAIGSEDLLEALRVAVESFANAPNLGALTNAIARWFRDLTGYDRAMVYQFDQDGHGKVIAEARHPRLDSLLGHRYPASDIPQRARDLYLRNRVRVLVDVHYRPAPLVPQLSPQNQQELDMSMCYLRSMSPLHTQYLKNMGVTATLVVSLVREGRLWGLIACHHYEPRNLRHGVKAAAELLAEVISSRLAAIENYAHAQIAVLVRRLEQRLIEATSVEGDWRLALFRNPHTLLQPLDATGIVLFYDDEMKTAGEVPSTPELRSLQEWIAGQDCDPIYSCVSIGREHPAMAALAPLASGVLAFRLSLTRPNFLVWLRKEQLQSVTWAGDPSKPVLGNDPLELSPRRSFAAWSEIVRGTSIPWSAAELNLARAFGTLLADIVLQVHAVRLLVAEHQIGTVRQSVKTAHEPLLLGDASGGLLFANDAFMHLVGQGQLTIDHLDEIGSLFATPDAVRDSIKSLRSTGRPWKGELRLRRRIGEPLPVFVRMEMVPGPDGAGLGFMLILSDLSDAKRTAAARHHLELSLSRAVRPGATSEISEEVSSGDGLLQAIIANASVAAMDITDSFGAPSVAPLLEELEASTKRASALFGHIRRLRTGA